MDKPKLGSILVVDDDISLMRMLCEALRNQGYETEGFALGQKAMQRMKEHEFDILLTDLVMPEMNGIEVLKAGLDVDPNLVGIVMTGNGSIQTAVEAMRAGAFDYMRKPFKLDTLFPSMSRAMGVRSLKKENIELRGTLAMYELTKAVTLSTDLALVVNKVADAVIEQTGADEVSIMLPTSDDEEELYVAAVRGRGREHILGQRIKFGEGIAGWVARHHELLKLEGEVSDQRFKPMCPRPEINASISIPIMAGGRFIGVLNLNAINRRSFTAGQIKALSITVSIAGPTIQNAGLFQMLQEAEQKYRSIFENAVEGIFQTTPEGRLLRANPAWARLLGFESPEQAMRDMRDIGQQFYVNPADRERFKQEIEAQGSVNGFEVILRRRDGSLITVKMNARAVRSDSGAILCYEGTSEDITDRKRAEEGLRESEKKYRAIFENAAEGIFQSLPEGRFTSVNPAMANIYGYESPEDMMTSITSIAKQLWLNPEDSVRYKKILNERGVVEGFEAPSRKKDGTLIWVKLSARAAKASDGAVFRYDGIVEDITSRKQAEEELKQTVEKLRNALAGTIQAMSMMVEARDPYTAGHQRRVSILAGAIAGELGLSRDIMDSIAMAGTIHDIGKISIPADILSKPTKLSSIEMNLIKTHSRAGYDVLKDVHLPYPVADIILQHHERLDGSGYPEGLKDGKILLEAKIISVADVVEAMVSHRPYRPGLGIEVALEEIEKNIGILYDNAAVGACLRLFREKGYQLEGT